MIGSKLCVPDSATELGYFNMQDPTWAAVQAGTGSIQGGTVGFTDFKKFGGGAFQALTGYTRFNTNVGGRKIQTAELRLTKESSTSTDGFSWGCVYSNYAGGAPVIGDWFFDSATSIITPVTIASIAASSIGTKWVFPITDLTGMNPSGYTSIAFFVFGSTQPTGENNVVFTQWPFSFLGRLGPMMAITYDLGAAGASSAPPIIHGQGAC